MIHFHRPRRKLAPEDLSYACTWEGLRAVYYERMGLSDQAADARSRSKGYLKKLQEMD